MDTTDPLIHFDDSGICNYCQTYRSRHRPYLASCQSPGSLDKLISQIRKRGKNSRYDAILGLSGGVDSSYLALKAKDWGLRLLAFHVDAGWNSEVSASNINSLVNYCGFDFATHVVDWSEMRDLQLSYIKSGVSNLDCPQDHAYFAALFNFAASQRIPTVLSGGNLSTEGIAPDWMYDPLDLRNLEAIQSSFGSVPLKLFPKLNFFRRYFLYPLFFGLRVLRPLNYISYNRNVASQELSLALGWKDYGSKHSESVFTRFYQSYYLPHFYAYDKRRPHLSSLIASGQLSRSDALALISKPSYTSSVLAYDLQFIANKLGITQDALKTYLVQQRTDHLDYANQSKQYRKLKRLHALWNSVFKSELRFYS
jgi:N-acetyl sugar amidotransferase